MSFFQKYKKEALIFFGIAVLFLAIRTYNISSLPIFTDEAIYVRWAQIAKNDANWRFISLTDGKQPMFVWLAMITMKLIKDPLLAGRLVSVGAGFVSMIGMYFLGREVFKNRWIGLISSALYVIFPMSLVYDRMALYDTLVGTFSIWSLYFTILLVRTFRLDVALILGMVIGGGILTKSSGFFNIYLLPFSLLILDWGKQERLKRLLKLIGLFLVVVILAEVFYSILRLSPFNHIIAEKNTIFIYPFSEWLTHPFTFAYGNSKAVWDWLLRYTTWPVLVLIVGSFFVSRKFLRENLMLLVWFLIPAAALAIFGKTLYPRFILFMTLPLLPLASFSLFKIYGFLKIKRLFIVFFMTIFFLQIKSDYLILNDFSKAPIPGSDLSQYSTDWPAGEGVKEAVGFFQKQSEKGKIYIATEGTFGLMPFSLEIYLVQNPNITIEGYWPIGDRIPQKVIDTSRKMPTYFVFYQPCVGCKAIGVAPEMWKMDIIFQQEKIKRKRFFTLYQVNP